MRRALAILALLVFGAVAQTLTAYAIALRTWEVHDDPWPRELLMDGWPGPMPPEWRRATDGIIVHPQRRFSNATAAWDWQNFRGSGDGYQYELNMWRMGWPLRSVAAYRHGRMPDMGRIFREPHPWRPAWMHAWMKGYVQPPATRGDPRRVWPLFPLWSGLLANTLIFAAVPAGAWSAITTLTRRWRLRRGQCIACGYDIRGLSVCPECGTALRHIPPASYSTSKVRDAT